MVNFSVNWPLPFNTAYTNTPILTKEVTLKFSPQWYLGMGIQWSIPASWGECFFNIYRSEMEYGSYERINPGLIKTYNFVDTTTMQGSKFSKDYYKLGILFNSDAISTTGNTIPSGTVYMTKAFSLENTQTPWVSIRAREISRREIILLRKFVGVESYVFKRRTYGKRCPVCWDSRYNKATRDDCPNCFGTTFDGGYFPPVKILMQYDVTPNTVDLRYFGKFEFNQLLAWTTTFPEIDSLDVIARIPDKRVYRVESVDATELQTVMVRQSAKLTELDKQAIENRLILNEQ